MTSNENITLKFKQKVFYFVSKGLLPDAYLPINNRDPFYSQVWHTSSRCDKMIQNDSADSLMTGVN